MEKEKMKTKQETEKEPKPTFTDMELEEEEEENLPFFVGEALGALYIKQRVAAFDNLDFPEGSLFLTEDSSKNWKGDEGVCFIPLGYMKTKEYYKDGNRLHMGIAGHCDFQGELCLVCRDHPPICAKCCHNAANPFSDECYDVQQFIGLFLGVEGQNLSKIDTPTLLRIPFKRITLPGYNQVESIQLGLRLKGIPSYGAVLRYKTFQRQTSRGRKAFVPRIGMERLLTQEELESMKGLKKVFKASLSGNIPPPQYLPTHSIPRESEGALESKGAVKDPLELLEDI